MTARFPRPARFDRSTTWTAAVFDVDGVLLCSPHERAWRDALATEADRERFTTALYQAHVAGKPRLAGALSALRALGVPDADRQAAAYAERKQQLLEALVRQGAVAAYPDALRFVAALAALRWRLAVASSSKNATSMLLPVRLASGGALLDAFAANVCGRDVPRGKPDPALFLLAADALQVDAAHCLVIEDAPSGIEAARSAGMAALGVARHDDAALLSATGADLVVTSLDEVAVDELAKGRLARIAA
jgi:beta-phosphoglucomutase